jgi:hypothetical protein
MVYPLGSGAPQPNLDLPESVKRDYYEARQIAGLSPKGAAALLRLTLQELCIILGAKGDLNQAISDLVGKGLSIEVKQALDTARVIGNNAVHPGQIDLQDDPGTVLMLFELINIVADRMISEPRRISEAYEKLPAGAKEAIVKRDSKAK